MTKNMVAKKNPRLAETTILPVPARRVMKMIVTQPFSVHGVYYLTGEIVSEVEIALDPAVADRLDTGFLRVTVE